MDDQPRVAPGSRRQIGFVNALITGVIGRASHGRPPNVFTTSLATAASSAAGSSSPAG